LKIFAVILIIIGCLAAAEVGFAASLDEPSGSVEEYLDEFQTQGQQIAGAIQPYAERLFWILATIQLTWAACTLALKGELSLTSFAQTLVREIMNRPGFNGEL
jgi:type IV secretory pathway TrbL component